MDYVTTALDLSVKIFLYFNEVKHASQEQLELFFEMKGLEALLQRLRQVDSTPPDDPWSAVLRDLTSENGLLSELNNKLLDMTGRLNAKDIDPVQPVQKPGPLFDKAKLKKGAKKIFRDLSWPFSKTERDDIMRTIERLKSTLLLAFQQDMKQVFFVLQDLGLMEALSNFVKSMKEDLPAVREGVDTLVAQAKGGQILVASFCGMADGSANRQ